MPLRGRMQVMSVPRPNWGVIGAAEWNLSTGAVTNLIMFGCIYKVTFQGTGVSTVFFSPQQRRYGVTTMAASPGNPTLLQIAVNPGMNPSGFVTQAVGISPIVGLNAQYCQVTIFGPNC